MSVVYSIFMHRVYAFVKCYFLTVSIMASLVKLVVQAMRLDAVVSVSFVHESHSESISLLCPQHWTWTNREQWKLLNIWCTNAKSIYDISGKSGSSPYRRVLSAENRVFVVWWWWSYHPCTLCISLSCNGLRSFDRLCRRMSLNHYDRKWVWEESVNFYLG